MPSTRLLLQMPSASQPLQILRSATTSTAAAFHPSCVASGSSRSSRSSRSSSSSRNTRNVRNTSRCRYSSTLATASPAATLLSLSAALRSECESCSRTRHRVASFGTVSTSQRTAFPRHGKAVAPLAPLASEVLGKAEVQASAAKPPTPEKEEAGLGDSRQAAQRPQQEKKEEQRRSEGQPGQLEENKDADTRAEEARTDVGIERSEGQKSDAAEAEAEAGRTDGDGSDVGSAAEAVAATAAGPADVIELGPPTTPAGPIEAIFGGSGQDASGSGPDGTAGRTVQPLSQRQPPHLVPPPYVHHFDSYSLVRQLAISGYTQAQAITAMKAVRSLLGRHLDVAQAGLVSKSDVENEAYLFKAACAELGIEVRNNRRRADEQMRQQRALLQHEVDIAAQSVSQELLTLNDVVRGLFDDRKMAVREEQKAAESQIQKLNYKITIMLNSEMRSEIEGVRWVLIRRSVLGIIFMVIVSLGSLRYASYRSHEEEKERERQRQLELKLEAEQAARAAEAALRVSTAAAAAAASADSKTETTTALPEDAEFLTAN